MTVILDLSMAPKTEEAKPETGIVLDLSVAPKKQIPGLDLSSAEPEDGPGVLKSAGHGLTHGTLGLGEAAGSGMEYLGNRMIQAPREMPVDLSEAWKQLTPGQRDEAVIRMSELEEGGTPHPEAYRQALEDQYGARITQGPGAELGRKMIETGRRTVKYFHEWAQEYAPDESLQGSILEKPELMLTASWWAYNVGDMVPSLAASLLPAAGTAKIIQVGGRVLQWTPAVIQRVAMLGGAVAGGISGGALEGSHTYQEVLRGGGSEEEAARAAELMALFSAGLNFLSTGRMLTGSGKGIKGKIAKYMKSGATEGTTEWLEEGADVLAQDLGKYLSGEEMPDGTFGRIVESLRNGFNIFPIAFVTGAGGSMVAGGAAESGGESESSAAPVQEQAQAEGGQESAAQPEEVAQAETPAAEDIPVFTREDARQSLEENLGEDEAGAVLDLWDMRAEAWAEQTGKSPEQWFESTLADIWKGDEAQFQGRENLLYQGREQDSAQAVMDWLKPFQDGAERALPMVVTDEVAQWPAKVQAKAEAEGVTSGAVYDEQTGTIYLTADAVTSEEQAAAVWFHEQGIHHGIRGLMNDDAKLDGFLDATFKHFGEESFAAMAEERNLDITNEQHRRELAEERLANIAEKIGTGESLDGVEQKSWTEFIRMVWEWLRGMDMPLISDKEIARVVRDSVRWTIGDGQVGTAGAQGESTIVNPIDPSLPQEAKVAELEKLTNENEPLLQEMIQEIDATLGTSSQTNRKTAESIIGKANRPSIKESKPWFDVEHLRDSFRFMTVVNSFEDIQEAARILNEKGVEVVKLDTEKMLNPKAWGWRMVAFDLRMPNGQLVEWYLPLQEMEEAKKKNHSLFERWRNESDEYLAENYVEFLADREESLKRYQAAWDSALRRLGLDSTAATASWNKVSASLESLTSSKSFMVSSADGTPLRQDPSGSRTTVKSNSSSATQTRLEPGSMQTALSIGTPPGRESNIPANEAGSKAGQGVSDDADTLNQTRAGVNAAAVEFLEDARGIIRLFEAGDVPAIIHETGHILRRQLPENDLAVVESHFNVQDGKWTREAEESFADTFERYVYEQKAPTMRLRLVLNRLRTWLVKLYGNIRNLRGGEIHDDVRQVFDRLMTTEQARQAEKDPASPASSFKVNAELYGVENVVEPADVAAMRSFDDVEAEAQRRAFAHADKEKRKLERSLVAEWRKEAHEVAGEVRLFRVLADYTGVLDRGTKNQRSKPGIDIHLIRQDFGEDTTKEILKKRPGLLRSTGGVAYDTVASAYGYADGEEMVRDLVEGPRKGEFIDDYIQERLDHHEQLKALDDDYGQEYAAIQNHALDILAQLTKRQTEKIKTAKIREEVGSRRIMNLGKARFAMRRERESLYKRSRAAFNNGQPDQAHLLLNQMHNLDMQLREVERAIAERDRIQNSIKYNLNRRIPNEYKEHLRAFVARFGLARPGNTPRESTLEFLTMKGVAQWMDMDAIRYLHKVAPGALTVDQLKQVDTVVKTLVHWGDHEGKLLAGEEMREYQTVLEDVCLSVMLSRKKRGSLPDPRFPEPPSARRKSPFTNFLRGVDSLHGNLLKPEFIFRSLDGFKEFGTVWSEMFQPLKKAEDKELELGGEIFAKLEEAFKPFQKQFRKWGRDRLDIKYMVKDPITQKEVEHTLPQKLTREEIIMVALNSGNPGNRNALYKGYKWNKKQLRGILLQLTKEEWKLVNTVWRTIDTIYPHLNEMHMKLKGVPLSKVKGAYFPLMFDRELSWKADRFAEMAAQRDLFQGIYSKPKPNDPMIKDRKGGTMPPLLSFRIITRHVTDGVHLATHGVAIRDVQKLMSDPSFRQAVEQTWGEGRYRNIAPWLQNIARPNREPMTIFEKWANRLRMNTTVVSLGLKVSVAMKQFLSFTQTIDELGFTDAMKGIGAYVQNPWKAQEFVNSRSLAMRNRRKRWDREVQAMYGKFNPTAFKGKQAVRDAFFWMIGLVDAVATYPTWLAAYAKGMQKNNWEETKAVEYADMVVRRTQPVSAAKDLADIQRGGAFKKLGTMFYTFFSVFTNRLSEVTSRVRHDPNYTAKDAFKSTMWLLIVPAILGDAISKRELPEDEWDYAKSIIGYGLAGVPFIRDIASPILSGFDYTFSPVQDALEAPSDLYNAFSTKKDKGRKITKHSIMAAGYLWGLPSRQVAITVDGALDLTQGKTNDPFRLLFPKKWEDRKSDRTHYTFPRR